MIHAALFGLPASGFLAAIALANDAETTTIVLIAVSFALAGVSWTAAETPIGKVVHEYAPADKQEQAFAAQFSIEHSWWLVAYPMVGILGDANLVSTSILMALVSMIAFIVFVYLWRPAHNEVTTVFSHHDHIPLVEKESSTS